MGESVKLSVELAHGDGLGVEYKGMHQLKRHSSWSELALQSRESVPKDLVALQEIDVIMM